MSKVSGCGMLCGNGMSESLKMCAYVCDSDFFAKLYSLHLWGRIDAPVVARTDTESAATQVTIAAKLNWDIARLNRKEA